MRFWVEETSVEVKEGRLDTIGEGRTWQCKGKWSSFVTSSPFQLKALSGHPHSQRSRTHASEIAPVGDSRCMQGVEVTSQMCPAQSCCEALAQNSTGMAPLNYGSLSP